MPSRPIRLSLRATAGALLGAWLVTLSASPIALGVEVPAAPPSHLVWETREVLTLATLRKVESFLLQHQHLTGERILVAIHPWEEGTQDSELKESAEKASRWLFDHWGLETRSRGANALLLLTETGPSRLRVGFQMGSGITLPEGRSTDGLQERLEEFADDARSLGSWDAIGLAAVHTLFEQLDSPILAKLGGDAWQLDSRPAGQMATETTPLPRPDRGAGWVAALLLMLAAGTVFYWTFEQRMTQEVLLGAERWLVLGPRLKLELWMKKRQHSKRIAGNPATGRWVILKENP